MSELTVKCGCGRTMSPDGRRGHGAYRCGCGLAIQISGELADRGPRCVGEDAGKPCRIPPVTKRPFRLCSDHYRQSGLERYHQWLTLGDEDLARKMVTFFFESRASNATEADDELGLIFYQELRRLTGHLWYLNDTPEAARAYLHANDPETRGFVYFIRHNNNVKIGKSIDPEKRRAELSVAAPGAELLATERGYSKHERLLHLKFSFYRQAGEWFALGPGLVDYINKLRKAAGQPPIDVPPEHVDKIRSTL